MRTKQRPEQLTIQNTLKNRKPQASGLSLSLSLSDHQSIQPRPEVPEMWLRPVELKGAFGMKTILFVFCSLEDVHISSEECCISKEK